jgi:hypothetical protein
VVGGAALLPLAVVALGLGLALATQSGEKSLATERESPPLEAPEVFTADQGGPLEYLLNDSMNSPYFYNGGPWFSSPDFRFKVCTLSPNDNLSVRLNQLGVPYKTIHCWSELAKDKYDFHRVKPGQSFSLWKNRDNEVVRFVFNINSREQLVISKTKTEGEYKAERVMLSPSQAQDDEDSNIPRPAWIDPATGYYYYRGTIHKNFYNSALAAGMTPGTTMIMSKIFAHLNFSRDLREGDRFSVVYEVFYNKGTPFKAGRILAAEFVNDGKTYRAVYFKDREGHDGYYTPDGKNLRKAFDDEFAAIELEMALLAHPREELQEKVASFHAQMDLIKREREEVRFLIEGDHKHLVRDTLDEDVERFKARETEPLLQRFDAFF